LFKKHILHFANFKAFPVTLGISSIFAAFLIVDVFGRSCCALWQGCLLRIQLKFFLNLNLVLSRSL